MGWLEFFTGPVSTPDPKRGDYRPQGDYAKVSDRAITPDNRSTPGFYYSGDLVRAAEKQELVVSRELVDQVKTMGANMAQNAQNMAEFSEAVQYLGKGELETVRQFAKLKPAIAKLHAQQNQAHNQTLTGLDSVAVQYQSNRQQRLKGSQQIRQSIGQMQQQQRMLRG